MHRSPKGFTLIEILISLSIITIALGALLAVGSAYIMRRNIAVEDAKLKIIAKDIQDTFSQEDFSLNISALPGDTDSNANLTVFSATTTPSYSSITGYEWFSKIARWRGHAVTAGAAVSTSSQPSVFDIAYNDGGLPRLLFAGPTNEPNYQRYLLVSLISPNHDLVLPPFQATTAWFDAIWDTPWDRSDVQIPALWDTLLTPDQVAAWNNQGAGLSRVQRLRVVEIIQRKHILTVDSNHPTDSVYITSDNGAIVYPTIAPATGVNTISGILHGRLLDIATGDTQADAKHSQMRIIYNDNFVSQ